MQLIINTLKNTHLNRIVINALLKNTDSDINNLITKTKAQLNDNISMELIKRFNESFFNACNPSIDDGLTKYYINQQNIITDEINASKDVFSVNIDTINDWYKSTKNCIYINWTFDNDNKLIETTTEINN